MPKKLDRCVKKVSKSLKKYGRKGSPYAICKASLKKKGTRPLTLTEQAKQFSSGLNKIQKKYPDDISKQAKESDKLYRMLQTKRVKIPVMKKK